jgi:hypothetical protein
MPKFVSEARSGLIRLLPASSSAHEPRAIAGRLPLFTLPTLHALPLRGPRPNRLR